MACFLNSIRFIHEICQRTYFINNATIKNSPSHASYLATETCLLTPDTSKMNILNKIIQYKKQEVAQQKQVCSLQQLEQNPLFDRTPLSLKEALQQKNKLGIIAEFKRQSPSKGIINAEADVITVTSAYAKAGAAAISILTDQHFFGGHNDFLTQARPYCPCPILRKEFIIDEYQIIEAKAIGADAILLIAEVLDKKQVKQLAILAQSLGLSVLLEIHTKDQLPKINEAIDVVGINNRNLKTFTVSIENSLQLYPHLPKEVAKISESGISQPKSIIQLQQAGFDGFLIGETFMKTEQPAQTCANFIQAVKRVNAD